MSQARVIYFGLAALYLVAAVVQFFLAGLAVFGATNFDPHSAVGFAMGIGSIALLIVGLIARLPRTLLLLTVLLVGLNVLQLVLANVDVSEVAALHPVNGVAIVFLAYELTQRSRRYVASKMAA